RRRCSHPVRNGDGAQHARILAEIDDSLIVACESPERRVVDRGFHLRGQTRIARPQQAFPMMAYDACARPCRHIRHLGHRYRAARSLASDGGGAMMFGMSLKS